jgi:hypothetical protein
VSPSRPVSKKQALPCFREKRISGANKKSLQRFTPDAAFRIMASALPIQRQKAALNRFTGEIPCRWLQ